ncbi:MAG: hypothetical protein F6K03_12935 [Kamptonema sp. SIO4C4]|nr:hypothetical protein [Kamptonema sp. SIO4C4]
MARWPLVWQWDIGCIELDAREINPLLKRRICEPLTHHSPPHYSQLSLLTQKNRTVLVNEC